MFTVLSYFRLQINKGFTRASKVIEKVNPDARGAIFPPDEDIKLERDEIIKRNRELGRDTPFSELRND